jgi:hypothetical protein
MKMSDLKTGARLLASSLGIVAFSRLPETDRSFAGFTTRRPGRPRPATKAAAGPTKSDRDFERF